MNVTIKAVVITVSDRCSRGEAHDLSGPALVQLLEAADVVIDEAIILSDDLQGLSHALRHYSNRADINLIVTTGGTGFGPRDNTPEATLAVIERQAPGLAEAMRLETLKHTPMAMLSRGVCGIRKGTLILNMPGSPKGVRESFAVVRPVLIHAIALLAGRPHDDAA